MFLKRIELTGFKSFADKTELEFVPGITAVVGPNGSGKSNISDAIRWVLGEQSAKSLRGGNMQDVIFSGSDSRKPVNYSEVTLSLDNSDYKLALDYSEITVTRRLHRSGESEYFINRQPCRLKDITELFMDTGIGKEAYSIIGQGRIEEILSTRSEDRRGIFDEASGIVKYKTRRKEAQKKLEETEQNLLRIHDLISELEDQLEPLREQSETAKLYKQLKEELKRNEISMYIVQIDQLHKSWKEAGERLDELQRKQLELSALVSRHDAGMEEQRLKLRAADEELEELHGRLLKISEEFDRTAGQGEVLRERQKNMKANRDQLRQTIEQQAGRMQSRKQERELLKAKYDAIALELDELSKSVKAEEAKLAGIIRRAEDAGETLKAELIDAMSRIAQVRNELKFLEQQDENIRRRMERLAEEKNRWTGQQQAQLERKAQLAELLERCGGEIAAVRNEYIRLSEKMNADQRLAEECVQTIRRLEQKLEALVSRRDTLKELQSDYDGYAHGVREVLKNRGKALHGVHGAVAELIKVPEKYETAVEIALGGALQHIVMDDEASAREAIDFLKKRQAGRATFLPLDVIRARSLSGEEKGRIRGMAGFVGIAGELVEFEPRYADIVGNLLGQIVIAERLEDANRIAASCKYRYRVVTLDGDVVNPGGSMTGGSLQKRGAGLLGRERQIAEIDGEIAKTEKQLQELKEKHKELQRENAETAAKLDELRRQGERKRMEEHELRSELQQCESELQHIGTQLDVFEQDHLAHEQDLRDAAGRKEELAAELERLEGEERRIRAAIEETETARRESESEKEELQRQLTDLKVKAARLAQEKASLEEQLTRFETDLAESESEHATSHALLEQLERDIEAIAKEIVDQIERQNALQLEKESCTEQIAFKRAERAEMNRNLDEAEEAIREQRQQLRGVEEQLRQTEVRVNRLDVELDTLLRKLSEEYEISYELAKSRYPAPEDMIAVQNRVRELKREINALGEVNLGAIEEYERIHERHKFLSGQKADLIEAKANLYRVIDELNEEMARRFRTTFEAIRAQFAVVFARLFGGGRADLLLEEPEQILETGIAIVAQPPGKKLQNLQLLSGGERALTAIALLFAILRVKPVPFCVLDEVEAALDEANVIRFAEYLREFSKDTQFIVVTHRKGTMEEADVLYGVTMEEDGVSKLVSVRLEDEAAVSA